MIDPLLNRHSGLKKRLKSIPLRHEILHIDLIHTYVGLLCRGKNDFEAVDGVRQNLFFQRALGIGHIPSSARLRQRFDEQAEALTAAVDDCLAPLLKNLRAPVTPLSTGHVTLRVDVFCLDAETADAATVITLYRQCGTSGQYHSEFKTDLDLERLPSGKFATNALMMALAAMAYNLLRYVGQNTLIGPDAPLHKTLHRCSIRTVMQEMIYKAAHLVRHVRRYILRFGRGDPEYHALARCHAHILTL